MLACLLLGSWLSPVACAQAVTVQQPAFQQFSTGTTVMVPDRGTALLGSVSRGADSRNRYGFFQPGSSRGSFRQHSSVSTKVWIHDLRAMDEMILNSAPSRANIRGPAGLTGSVRHAYSELFDRSAEQSRNRSVAGPNRSSSAKPGPLASSGKGAAYYRMGLRALKQNRASVAKIHFRMAAKHGSISAERELRKLNSVRNLTEK